MHERIRGHFVQVTEFLKGHLPPDTAEAFANLPTVEHQRLGDSNIFITTNPEKCLCRIETQDKQGNFHSLVVFEKTEGMWFDSLVLRVHNGHRLSAGSDMRCPRVWTFSGRYLQMLQFQRAVGVPRGRELQSLLSIGLDEVVDAGPWLEAIGRALTSQADCQALIDAGGYPWRIS